MGINLINSETTNRNQNNQIKDYNSENEPYILGHSNNSINKNRNNNSNNISINRNIGCNSSNNSSNINIINHY